MVVIREGRIQEERRRGLKRLRSSGHGWPLEACRDRTSRQAGRIKRKDPEGTA